MVLSREEPVCFGDVVLRVVVFQQNFVSEEKGSSDSILVSVIAYDAIVMVVGVATVLKPVLGRADAPDAGPFEPRFNEAIRDLLGFALDTAGDCSRAFE